MDSKDFILFQYDTGALFENSLASEDVEGAFEVLTKVKSLDGSKKLEKNKDDTVATFTTADNKYELTLSNEDLVVSFTNRTFEANVQSDVERVNELLLKACRTIGYNDIEQARARQIVFSPKLKDRKFITNQIINSSMQSHLDSLDVDFNFDEPDINGKALESWAKVSYEHTTEMHKIAEQLNKESILDKLIVLYVGVGCPDKLDLEQTTAFLAYMATYHSSFKILERFGYGS